jgi:hypothetical protein
MKYKHYRFNVSWSEEDKEWVATVEQMVSLSYLARTPIAALAGLIDVIEDFEGEVEL